MNGSLYLPLLLHWVWMTCSHQHMCNLSESISTLYDNKCCQNIEDYHVSFYLLGTQQYNAEPPCPWNKLIVQFCARWLSEAFLQDLCQVLKLKHIFFNDQVYSLYVFLPHHHYYHYIPSMDKMCKKKWFLMTKIYEFKTSQACYLS